MSAVVSSPPSSPAHVDRHEVGRPGPEPSPCTLTTALYWHLRENSYKTENIPNTDADIPHHHHHHHHQPPLEKKKKKKPLLCALCHTADG